LNATAGYSDQRTLSPQYTKKATSAPFALRRPWSARSPEEHQQTGGEKDRENEAIERASVEIGVRRLHLASDVEPRRDHPGSRDQYPDRRDPQGRRHVGVIVAIEPEERDDAQSDDQRGQCRRHRYIPSV
jgi:hypothetical protein